MSYITVQCPCGKSFRRDESEIVSGRTYTCSKACQKLLTERPDGTKCCAGCKLWFPLDTFPIQEDTRYKTGFRRTSYCPPCKSSRRKSYHSKNKDTARRLHNEWRERCLAVGGEKALRWYFTRHLGAYRQRNRELGLICDLDTDYLVNLFHKQEGKCFYTGDELDWDTHGRGRGQPRQSSISLDRLTPALGYVQGNVVLCGYLANTSKGNRTELDFYAFCERVLKVRDER